MIRGKKATADNEALIWTIVFVVSLVVILASWFIADLFSISDEETCRNSVVLKSQNPAGFGSLNCKTEYVTIDSETKEAAMNKIAEKMASCWYVFGEGKLDYGGKDFTGYQCAICSSITFEEGSVGFSYKDLFSYLENTKKTDSQTYLQYIFGFSKAEDFVSQSEYLTANYNSILPLNEKYSILTGRNEELTGSDKVLPVYFIKTNDISQTPCDEFLTKA